MIDLKSLSPQQLENMRNNMRAKGVVVSPYTTLPALDLEIAERGTVAKGMTPEKWKVAPLSTTIFAMVRENGGRPITYGALYERIEGRSWHTGGGHVLTRPVGKALGAIFIRHLLSGDAPLNLLVVNASIGELNVDAHERLRGLMTDYGRAVPADWAGYLRALAEVTLAEVTAV
jgi:hypothetical protein